MTKKRKEEWQINEWDESLDAKTASPKDPFAPVTPDNWETNEDWDSPASQKPGQKSKWKWIAVAGGLVVVIALLVMILRPAGDSGQDPAGTADSVALVAATESATVSPEQISAKGTEPPTKVPTEKPTTSLTQAPATSAPVTDSPTPELTSSPLVYPDGINCSWYGPEMRYYYQQLSDREKECFKVLYNGVTAFEKKISIEHLNISKPELDRAVYVLRYDCPELFQIDGNVTYWYDDKKQKSVEVVYRLTQDIYEERCQEIRDVQENIQRSFGDTGNEYDKEYAVYKWLIEHCEYLILKNDSTAYADSALCLGKAQCSGYSKAISLLLRSMGIQCMEVLSIPEQEHQWNIVQIQGDWYQCDVTWDDPPEGDPKQFEDGQNVFLCYFNVPDRRMTDHTQNQDGFVRPVCTSIAANYVFREGIYISSSDDIENLAEYINSCIETEWKAGGERFMIMIDDDSDTLNVMNIKKQVQTAVPSTIFSPEKEETHCFYIRLGEGIKIHFIDVGQGDAILVQCNGESLLIDAGPAEAGRKVNQYLEDILGSDHLNYVIATHEHDDHIGGMPEALTGFSVGGIWSSSAIPISWWKNHVFPGMKEQSVQIKKPVFGDCFALGGAAVQFINPMEKAENANDLSLAIRITYGNSVVLLMADVETEAEQSILKTGIPLKADILKVAHHGGNSSSSEAFIREVSPDKAVISVGEGNKHGHPNDEPLRCLDKYHATVYRTDQSGTIVCSGNGALWTVKVERTR